MVFRAILNPPEAEPVIPAKTLITIASEIRGLFGAMPTRKSRRIIKPANEAMTEP